MLRVLLELCPRQEERREHNKGHFIWREELSTHTPALNRSLTKSPSGTSSEQVCSRCQPIISRYAETFKGLIHQETELRKCKKQIPNPKCIVYPTYRDLKRQNEWLRGNVFDAMGNYLYCCTCIRISL